MLIHPTMTLLAELGLHGMAKGFQELQAMADSRALEHADWLALLLERESTMRRQKRFENRARAAALRHNASIEDVDFKAPRGLDRGLFLKLAGRDWIRQHRSLLITGPAGVGKSWLACPLGHKACRDDISVAYHRAPRLFATLAQARDQGRYARLLKALARVELLIIDDWGRRSSMIPSGVTSSNSPRIAMSAAPPSSPARSPRTAGTRLSEIPRSLTRSWIAAHNAYRIELTGESLRKRPSQSLPATPA